MIKFKNLIHTELAVVVYVALVVLTPLWKVPSLPAIRLDDIWLLLVAMMMFVRIGSFKIDPRLLFPFICIITISLMSVVSFIVAGHLDFTFFSVLSTLRLAVLIYVVSQVSFSVDGMRLLGAAVISTGVVNIGAAIVYYYNIAPFDLMLVKLFTSAEGYHKYAESLLYIGHMSRAGGTMGNPNYLGVLFALCMLLSLDKIFNGKFVSKVFSFLCLIGFAFSIIFFLQSRTGMLIGFASLVTYASVYLVKRGHVFGYLILILVPITSVLLMAGAFAFPELLPRRMASVFHAESFSDIFQESGLMGSRVEMWTYQLEQIFSQPVTFIFGYMPYAPTTTSDNGYIAVFYRSGFLGLIAYLGLMMFFLKSSVANLMRTPPRAPELGMRVVVLIFCGMNLLLDLTSDTVFSAKWSAVAMVFLLIGMREIRGVPIGNTRSATRFNPVQ